MNITVFLSIFCILGTKLLFGDKPVSLGSIVLTSLLSAATTQLTAAAMGDNAYIQVPRSYKEALESLLARACDIDALHTSFPLLDTACVGVSHGAEAEAGG